MADVRLSPHYPVQSPIADILRMVPPGSDGFPLEKFAVEIEALLDLWGKALQRKTSDLTMIASLLTDEIEGSDLGSKTQTIIRSGFGVETLKRTFAQKSRIPRNQFLAGLTKWLEPASRIETTEFEIFSIQQTDAAPLTVRIGLRYDIVSEVPGNKREERVGTWEMEWFRVGADSWKAQMWHFDSETVCTVQSPAFVDITAKAFGAIPSYKSQLRTARTTGERCWTERLGSMYMATTGWRRAISTATVSMIFTFANLQVCRTGCIGIVGTAHSRMSRRRPGWACLIGPPAHFSPTF